MTLVSGKALWSIICGQSVLASDEVVGEELEEAATHLQEGMLMYKTFSEQGHKSWCTTTQLKKEKQDFVYKLGNLLELCSEQAWKMFQLFLQHEYRGSASQLQSAASSDREETSLLHQVFSFYLSDPLHLLSCRRHILSADSSHPYEKLFKEFTRKVLDADRSLGPKLVAQLKKMSVKEAPPSPKSVLPQLPPNASQGRILHQLSALKHQLATLLVYHGSPENPCSPGSVQALITLAQGVGLGREFVENCSRSEKSLFASQLDAIDAFHSFLITLVINADSDPKTHPLCDPEWVSRINRLMQSLGSKPWHYPPILAWAVLQGRRVANDPAGSADEAAKYSRLVQRAVRGNVFHYLESALKLPSFETDQLLLVLGSSVTYSLTCVLGSCVDLEKLELMPQVHRLAKVCLSFEPTSHFFWAEGGAEASVLLPSALEVFPHSSSALLELATSLASASKESAAKVVALLNELENFTWPVQDLVSVGLSGNQIVSLGDLFPLPGFAVPKDTHGTILNMNEAKMMDVPLIVCWHMTTNGWQVLLASLQLLRRQIDCGGVAEEWCLDMVVKGLHLLSTILRTDSQHAFQFEEIKNLAQNLLISVSQTLKPNYGLIAALLELFAETSKLQCSAFWNEMDGCALLPSLPTSSAGKKSSGSDLLANYRAGTIRSFVCGVEATTGNFTLLVQLCSLVQVAVKGGLNLSSVRGTVVFVVKEVIPAMLLWRCVDAASKVDVLESTFALVHHALEEGALDGELQELIVNELSYPKGGAGATLKSVLESSANLQATLDQPAEWPHSSHAGKLTKMAKLALSVAHRLVGKYLTSGDRLSNFFLEGAAAGAQTKSGGVTQGAWAAPRPPHLALTIAHFVHHRLNPRLPYLALRTLTKLAKEMGVPIVACLGSEAEGLRDCLLTRLDSSTEDLWVKVSILRLLTTSTPHQPGLIRLFLTPPSPLLDAVVTLLQQQKESKTEAGMELLLSLVELVASLWVNNLTTATGYLREKDSFWDVVSHCLCNRSPEEENEEVVGAIVRIYSLEYYRMGATGGGDPAKDSRRFPSCLKTFLDPGSDKFASWVKYVFLSYVDRKANKMVESTPVPPQEASNLDSDSPYGLLDNFCQFLVIVLSRSPNLLSDDQKRLLGLSAVESLLNLMETEGNEAVDALEVLLSEIHLSVISHCGSVVSESKAYRGFLGRLLGSLRSSVMQTQIRAQVMILAGTLKVLSSVSATSDVAGDLSADLVSSAMLLTEQHCVLASARPEERRPPGTSGTSACLALACTLLHQCFDAIEPSKVEGLLESSHLVYTLLQAAVKHTEVSNTMVAREIHRLLCLIARRTARTNGLTTNSLAMSVSLVLASQKKFEPAVLRDLLWCATFCLKKEGSSGLEGAVSLAAVHLPALTGALAAPDTQPDLALAAASLAVTLAPYQQLWRVLHPESFEQLTGAVGGALHRATKMLHLKESLEREVTGRKVKNAKTTEGVDAPAQSPLSEGTVQLINQLFQIVSLCLETVRRLSPEITELLMCCCCPGAATGAAHAFAVVQPSIRRQSGDQIVLPNLATLADVLDLYHTFVPKEVRHCSTGSPEGAPKGVDVGLLLHCAEEALHLLLVYSTLFVVLTPNVAAREARDVRTFLADETSSFFNHLMGRRSVGTSASPLPPQSPRLPFSDLQYFMLCRNVVAALCSPKKT